MSCRRCGLPQCRFDALYDRPCHRCGATSAEMDAERTLLLDTAAAKKNETAHRKRAPVGTWS